MSLEWVVTLLALGAAAGLFAFARARAQAPADPLRSRFVNYNIVMLLALIAILLAGAHVITLLTGQPFTGRRMTALSTGVFGA